ncbi:uncharacterized protein LOC126686631 [Mercurialis annua]|uniref:uncharacterized protein LOC126686631 n=1 Tax=Mercurialis annua TaxID=3986 RepID=UPI00215DDC30|nr:uncharacterized protein LOC126686631 [Mercurialis annua]
MDKYFDNHEFPGALTRMGASQLIVSGKRNVPRYSFTTWLALKNKLNTRDKLHKWGTIPDDKCCFCNQESETTRHLFFSCPFSYEVWKKVLAYLGFNRNPDNWNREVSFFTRRGRGKSRIAKVRKNGFCAAVYQIWFARNDLIFNKRRHSCDTIFNKIRSSIEMRN